jgi:hypothetical protein
MEVFISWSGEQSKSFAEALRNWLPKIINAVKPWLSSADIDKGARWSADVAAKLEASKIGVTCLTPSNMHSDWILFEAGALSKTIVNTHVCPVLIGLEPSDLHGPLAQFQATRANRDEIKNLLVTINAALIAAKETFLKRFWRWFVVKRVSQRCHSLTVCIQRVTRLGGWSALSIWSLAIRTTPAGSRAGGWRRMAPTSRWSF